MKLSEEARRIRNAYHRQYYATHKEQCEENKRKYWERKAKKAKEFQTSNYDREVMYWISVMCLSNKEKTYDRSLFPVREFISLCVFCGLTEQYAHRIYKYVLQKDYYQFEKDEWVWCYISGSNNLKSNWVDDYFIIPIDSYTEEEYAQFKDKFSI